MIGLTCSSHGEDKNCTHNFGWESAPFGRPKRIWKGNINTDLRETVCEHVRQLWETKQCERNSYIHVMSVVTKFFLLLRMNFCVNYVMGSLFPVYVDKEGRYISETNV